LQPANPVRATVANVGPQSRLLIVAYNVCDEFNVFQRLTKMADRRTQLESKLISLAANIDELYCHHQQVGVALTSASANQANPQMILSIADDSIAMATMMLKTNNLCSSELQDSVLALLDLVSVLVIRNSHYRRSNSGGISVTCCAATVENSTILPANLCVPLFLTFCVCVVWFSELCSAILLVSQAASNA